MRLAELFSDVNTVRSSKPPVQSPRLAHQTDWNAWDEQIQSDANSGRLNDFRSRALQQIQQEKQAGSVNEIPT